MRNSSEKGNEFELNECILDCVCVISQFAFEQASRNWKYLNYREAMEAESELE